MARSNKNSATEDEVGLIHKGINKAFLMATNHMLKKMEEAIKNEDDMAMSMAINDRLFNAATKWVQMNEVTCAMPEDETNNPLKKQLDAIKEKQSGRVIPMTKEG